VFGNPGSTVLDAVSRGPSLYCQYHVSADANRAPLFHSEAFYKQNDQILPFSFLSFVPLTGWFSFFIVGSVWLGSVTGNTICLCKSTASNKKTKNKIFLPLRMFNVFNFIQ